MATESQGRELESTATEVGSDPIVLAAAASVVLSWFHYFVRGNREMGLFVGLWPPTLLAFASYFRQQQIISRVENSLSMGSIRESVERMMRGQ